MKFCFSVITIFLFAYFTTYAQNGEEIYNKNCKACHTIGGGKLVGPDLKGINEIRTEDWLIKFTKDSKSLIESGDELANEVFIEYNKMPMPNQNLSDLEIKSILTYISELSVITKDDPVVQAPEFIEDATHNSIDSGALYFNGELKFANGGQNCIACHTISDSRVYVGGNLAKDLSTSYNILKAAGIKSILDVPPYPAMTEAYRNHNLTEREVYNLTAFIKYAGTNPSRPEFGFINSKFLMYSILLFVALLSLLGIYWGTGKFRSTNKEILDRQKNIK